MPQDSGEVIVHEEIARKYQLSVGAANMTGYIAGILLGVVVAWLTNICLIMDKAFYLELFDPLMVIGLSFIPVVVTCMCILAPLRYVREDMQYWDLKCSELCLNRNVACLLDMYSEFLAVVYEWFAEMVKDEIMLGN